MARQKVSEDKFLELLNEVLREEEGYTPEMRFIAAPGKSHGSGMRGYDTSTPYTSSGAYANAVALAHEMYEFDPRAD